MRRRWAMVALAAAAAFGLGVAALAGTDFGQRVQHELKGQSENLFGVGKPLDQSSAQQVTQAEAQADPLVLLTLAHGLHARVVTSGVAAPNLDMIGFWPDDAHPQWLIECNEQDPTQPGLQRINVATGEVDTILTGTTACDPVRRTPWGTIVFGEEAGGGPSGGRIYELTDPINTTGVILDRNTGTFSGGQGAENFAVRNSLGRLSFEGLSMFPDGLVYYGDENRPLNGTAGGAYFKFVPDNLLAPGQSVHSLDDSPLASGSIYGLRLGLHTGGTDYGQGTSLGFGVWVPVCAEDACKDADLRAQAAALHLTGYYRPEDGDVDQAALAQGNVRFCNTNTGNENEDQFYGEVICATDGTLQQAEQNGAIPEVQLLVAGSPAFAMPDNVAYQPGRANWVFHEDAETTYLTPHNNDLWDCLPDGTDPDLQSDGCIRIATLNDLTAEWTGGIFTADGKSFFVSVQHNISGAGTVFEITGWK